MDNDVLKKILKERSMTFTESELRQLLDEELEKSEDEMDTDLIDNCLEALSNGPIGTSNNEIKRRRLRLSRILLIAAVLILAFIIAIPVCAKFVHIDAEADVVKYTDDHFEIDLSDNSEVDSNGESVNVVSALRENGMDTIYLPSALFDENTVVDDLYVLENESTKFVSFNLTDNNIDYRTTISIYSNDFTITLGETKAPTDYDIYKQIKIGDVEALVVSENNNSYLYYISDYCEYSISLENSNFEKALEIANTIKGI